MELNREYLKLKLKNFSTSEKLSLGFKNIKKINPDAFDSLSNLETLWLNNNQIEELDSSNFPVGLTNLKELLLSNNRLTSIRANTFGSLVNLEYLHLNENKMNEIALEAFAKMKNLKSLCLIKNQIHRIKARVFVDLENLKILELDNNQISEIEPGSFVGLVNLKELHLDNNQLKSIKAKIFEPLKHLEQLYLDDNLIDEIDSGAFIGLADLKVLSLKNNQITTESSKAFQPLQASIGLIFLLKSFKTSSENAHPVSFFDTSVLDKLDSQRIVFFKNKWHSKQTSEGVLSKTGGYKSNFQEFLNQFSYSSSCKYKLFYFFIFSIFFHYLILSLRI